MVGGARVQARLRYLGEIESQLCLQVQRRLDAAGVGLSVVSSIQPQVPEVLVVPLPNDRVVTEIRSAVARNAVRVLVVCTRLDHSDEVWSCLQAGAADVVRWDRARPDDSAQRIASRLQHWVEVDSLLPTMRQRLVGHSPAWTAVLQELIEVGRQADAPVLLTGESGTGKELAAGLVHELDPRPGKKALVVLDCTTIVPGLSGSEFFGHERGAFTDAVVSREGVFGAADRGTLFLDELGELPLNLQAELLRVTQEGLYKRVGSSMWRRTRFRLVCATNRDLRAEVARGRFRNDLYHRLAATTIRLPSLKERSEDIPDLARHFLAQMRPGEPSLDFDDLVLDVLCRRAYPGNARELRQLVGRIAGRHVGPGPLTAGDLPLDERPRDGQGRGDWRNGELAQGIGLALVHGAKLQEIKTVTKDLAYGRAIDDAGGDVARAALRLGVSKRALQYWQASGKKNGRRADSS